MKKISADYTFQFNCYHTLLKISVGNVFINTGNMSNDFTKCISANKIVVRGVPKHCTSLKDPTPHAFLMHRTGKQSQKTSSLEKIASQMPQPHSLEASKKQ